MSIIDLRYAKLGTREELNADNIVLAFMQPGIEKDTGDTKLGDGRTKYRDLAYFTGSMTRTYRGEVASQGEMLALKANISDWCTRTDDGNRNYELTDLPASSPENWTSYVAGSNGTGGVSYSDMTAAIAVAKAEAQDRSKGTNNDPAANIVFSGDSLTLEQWRAQVDSRGTAGTNDPTVDTAPSLAGTVGVGNVLTLTRGTVTNGSGGAHLDVLSWYFIAPTTGLVTLLFAETIPSANTPATVTQQAPQVGGTIYVIQQAKDTVTQKLSNARTSNVKGPVTGTAPTNTGTAPAISGSAPSGSAISVNVGVWTAAASYVVQLYADGVPFGSPSTKSATNPVAMGNSDNTVVGKALTARVTAYSSLDVPSATAIVTSNSITVTGTAPAITNTSAVAFPATINFGTAANLTIGTYSAPVNATRAYEIYIGVPDSTPDFGPQPIAIHTPRSPAVVGNTLYVIERVYDLATGLTEVANSLSAGKVISAALATFAAALTTEGSGGYSWTQSSPITQATVATLSGGTQPWVLDPTTPFSPALPAGLTASISGSSLVIAGTPSVVSSATAYTANFKDSAGTPASASVTFNALVAAAGVTPATALIPANVSAYGRDETWTGQTITGSDSAIRIQRLSNYRGTGKVGYVRRGKQGDPLLFNGVRSEHDLFTGVGANVSARGVDVWYGADFFPYVGEWVGDTNDGSDQGIWFQIHQASTSLIANGPTFALKWNAVDNSMRCEGNYGTGSTQNNSRDIANAGQDTNLVAGQHNRIIVHLRFGEDTSYAPRIEVWHAVGAGAYVKRFDVSGVSALMSGPASGGEIARIGMYKWSSTSWSGGITSRAFDTSELFAGVGTNLFNEIAAALASFAV